MLCKFSKNKVLLVLGVLLFVLSLNSAFAELNYSTGSAVYGVLADTGNTNITNALNLTLQMRSCSLVDCSGASWSAVYTNATYTSLASLANASYFQYKATFFTENQNYTPYLFNITIYYTYLDTTFPLISYAPDNPADLLYSSSTSQTFNATVTEQNKNTTNFWWSSSGNSTVTCSGSAPDYICPITKSDLTSGTYTYRFYVNDYAGNPNSTETRTITIDAINPVVTFTTNTALNNAHKNQNYVYANVSVTETNFNNITYYLYNSSGLVNSTFYSSLITDINWTGLPEGIYYYNATVYDKANNNGSSETRTITLDTTNPLLSFVDPTPENNSGASGSLVINASITELNLKNATLNWNGTSINFNSSNESLTNLGDGNWLFTYTKSGLVIGQSYTYYVSVSDYAGNSNSTETRIIKGNAPPSFVSVLYTPNSTGELDPGVSLNVTVNVSDTDYNFDSAILQWKNASSDWGSAVNLSMNNLTENGRYNLMYVNFTLPSYEGNITFRIWANDTTGDFATSSNYAIQNFWDCTWTATSDLGPTSGWDENKFIGNITINNTGDYQYSDSHCSLDFRLTYDLTEGRVYLNGDYVKPTNIITIDAKYSSIIQVNATFLSEIKSENGIITTSEIRSRSATSSRDTTFVLVSNQAGPYLYQSITTYPASVYLTSGNFSLNGYVRNLMGDGTENNTAYNLSFYWDLPSGLINSSGNQNISLDNLSNNSLIYNSIIVGFSSLASMTPGVDEVYLHSQGYDKDGNLIADANNDTLLSNSISINFLCYNASDGICVSGCGYLLDSDCKAPETPGNPSGGGGGGGAASTSDTIMSKADFEFVRGNTSEIIIPFINKDENTTMTDLKFSLEGDIAKYISVSPPSIGSLEPQETIELHLEITSPGFIQLGKQALVLVITGMLGNNNYNERRTIVLQVNGISKSDAEQLINNSEVLIEKFKAEGFNYSEVDSLFGSMQESFNDLDYSTLQDSYNRLSEIVNSAIESKKIISELKDLIADAKKKGISVSGTEKILNLAELSFSRNDFTMALSRAQEARTTFALETKGEGTSIAYYLRYKTKEVVFLALFLFVIVFAGFKITKLQIIKNKIMKLKEEQKVIESLLRLVQRRTFEEKKMSMEEYQESMNYYEKKLSQIIEELIELEGKRVQALRFTTNESRLRAERERIIGMIKEIQRQYLKEKKLETKEYEIRVESYNRRLGQIDGAIATLEAKRDLKKDKGRGFTLK